MSEQLTFLVDASVIERLGRELVAKQETALIELVKNAFDADATKVEVALTDGARGPELQVTDDGTGMTREDLTNGFLRVASTFKQILPRSSVFARERAGSKGIGRFAAQRLGQRLTLVTRTDEMDKALRLEVDWNAFAPGKDLSEISVSLDDSAEGAKGTTLRIEGLRDQWSDAQVRRCWRSVLELQQPFPVAPVEGSRAIDPGFSVRFTRKHALLNDESVVADLQTEILDHLHAVIELRVDGGGQAMWRINKNRFGEPRDWAPIHHAHPSAKSPPPYESLRNIWMKTHYVILIPDLLPSLVYTRVRDVLGEFGGVRLYRNGFRVVPYGDPDNDWLQLDEMYAKRSVLAPIANRNFFGIVEIHDKTGKFFEEHTSREGLIETQAFTDLKSLTSSVLVTAGTRISEDRGKKTRAGAGSKPREKPATPAGANPLAALSNAVKTLQNTAEKAAEAGAEGSALLAAQARDAAQLVDSASSDFAAAEATLADEASMLRFLATLGMTSAEFNHETGMTFDAFRLDFDRIFQVAIAASKEQTFQDQAQRAKGMLQRLDTLTSYLNGLASARSAREMSAVSLTKALDDFERGMKLQAHAQKISVQVNTPAYDALYTRPMHQAEVASILLNLYTNAVKAIKRTRKDRSISIVAERVPQEGSVRILFSDTGDGIPVENRERIYDAFFTTSAAPAADAPDLAHASGTGLGLWIVKQIIDNARGQIKVIEAKPPFATCFEINLPAEQEDASS